MAKSLGTDLDGLREQLATTKLLTAPEARGFMQSAALLQSIDLARAFCANHPAAGSKRDDSDVGIELPGERVIGNPGAVRVRFDDRATALAAEGKLPPRAPVTTSRRTFCMERD